MRGNPDSISRSAVSFDPSVESRRTNKLASGRPQDLVDAKTLEDD